MFNLKKVSIVAAVAFLPVAAHAQSITDLKSLIAFIQGLINSIIPLLIGIAVIVFMWGIIRYILADGPDKVAEARNYIIMGIIGITVMMSVWGLVFLVKNLFFPDVRTPINFTDVHTPDPYSGE
jgi:hypothetical protein